MLPQYFLCCCYERQEVCAIYHMLMFYPQDFFFPIIKNVFESIYVSRLIYE